MYEIVRQTVQEVSAELLQEAGGAEVFELIGYDFIIDATTTVRLLEINISPTMEYSTLTTRKLVDRMSGELVDIVFGGSYRGDGIFEALMTEYRDYCKEEAGARWVVGSCGLSDHTQPSVCAGAD